MDGMTLKGWQNERVLTKTNHADREQLTLNVHNAKTIQALRFQGILAIGIN